MQHNPFEKDDWSEQSLQKTWEIINKIAKEEYGLDYYSPSFEVVSFEDMLHIYTGSLPIMYDHWSFGKRYIELHKKYLADRMGVAYEVVFNTNPALCYLLEHNSPTMQGLVMSHAAVGHSAFFKNNELFKEMTNASTIIPFLKNSKKFISECEEKYGELAVTDLLDCCHALSMYAIDKRPIIEKTQKQKSQQKLQRALNKDIEYDPTTAKIELEQNNTTGLSGPTRLREENILKFIGKFSPTLKPWQREIISIYCKIQQYLYPQMQTKMMNEGAACVDGETEYLSESGFKRIEEYKEGEKIAQYTEEGGIEFVIPSKYHQYKNAELLEINSESVNQCVTPNHRIVYKSMRGHINEIRADNLTTTTNRYFINGGNLKTNNKINLTNAELRVMCAIIADGHFNPNTTTKHCQIAFIKDRKIKRMEQLLLDANIPFEIQKQTQNRTCFSFYAPERNKELNKYYKASKEQLEIILDEYKQWDGCTKNGRYLYFGINKENMEFIQYAIIVTNGKARFTVTQPPGNRSLLYTVEKLKSKITTLSSGCILKKEGLHNVYCFSVPSGMFITRRRNKVTVTGNSFWHHTIMNNLSDKGLIPPGNMLEFIHSHCSVLRQDDFDSKYYAGINPYKLGFEIFKDIQRICTSPTEEDKEWFPGLIGKNWIEEVKFAAYNFKDSSFILQYLSPKLIRDFKLFILNDDLSSNDMEISDIHDDEGYREIRRKLSRSYDINQKIPDIYIEGWDAKKSRTLFMVFEEKEGVELEMESGEEVMMLVKYLWPFNICFKYKHTDGTIEEGNG